METSNTLPEINPAVFPRFDPQLLPSQHLHPDCGVIAGEVRVNLSRLFEHPDPHLVHLDLDGATVGEFGSRDDRPTEEFSASKHPCGESEVTRVARIHNRRRWTVEPSSIRT